MKNKLTLIIAILFLGLGMFAPALRAQEEIVIPTQVEGGIFVKPIPISLSGFSGEAAQVLQFDLTVQGLKIVNDGTAQYDVTGSNDGNVQGRITDRIAKAQILAKAYSGGPLRAQAHALADDIVFAITKRKGVGQTKIAFKVDTGAESEIYVSDIDGHNPLQATKDNSIVAAPTWSPGKMGLYYVSYKQGNAHIFAHNLISRERTVFARYNGLNISPAVSPDGSKVAMILSKDGWVDLYVCNVDGSGLKRLTKSPQDESSPCWTADSKWIVFAGKTGERRSLCKISAAGGEVQRIRTAGVSNPSEPDCSPDGKWIVFTAQMGGFELCVVPAEGGDAIPLVSGEDPSWAPNSRTVVFARRSGNGRSLSVLDVFTKQSKDVQRISGSNSQPSWAK